MPHGVLTPLGRQLRSVLASFCSSSLSRRGPRQQPNGSPELRRSLPAGRRAYHGSRSNTAPIAAIATAVQDDWYDDVAYHHDVLEWCENTHTERSTGSRRLKRRTRRDWLSEALRGTRVQHLAPRLRPRKTDISHVNVKSGWGRRDERGNAARHSSDDRWELARTTDLSLERLVASYIQHVHNTADDDLQPDWTAPYHLAHWEYSFLSKKGYSVADIKAWAEIVSTTSSQDAAAALAEAVAAQRRTPVPVFLLTYLLRRDYLSASALRVLFDVARTMLEQRHNTVLAENTIFIIFLRLLRHAREVWPPATPNIAKLLLTFLPRIAEGVDDETMHRLESLTYMLNKAMGLISIQTAIEPYKDVAHQEAAVAHVLSFMSEHRPPLQVTREGYRAVVRLQLAQGKTPREQQWAELKALSWPPWKQDRTAMDADITVAEHGVTRAAATLRRMREAGYGARQWEQTAELFAGWDVDGTPTIQTRALLGTGGGRFRSGATIWAARIATTRTAQEAWAAYLAYEDAGLAASDDVYLAVFQKLYAEEERQRLPPENKDTVPASIERDRLLPGDSREVEPLPPSTHLYTYTRTPVPTLDGFYRQLRQQGIAPSGHALAFIVANATRLQLGHWYLRSAREHVPQIQSMLFLESDLYTAPIPGVYFTAFVQLLCRFSNVPLSNFREHRPHRISRSYYSAPPLLDGMQLNLQHPLVFALELLRFRRTTFRPAWNAMLTALSKDETAVSMRFLRVTSDRDVATEEGGIERCRGSILAYRLVRRTLSMLQDIYVDLDSTGFHSLCVATENVTFASWKILRMDIGPDLTAPENAVRTKPAVKEANDLLRSSNHVSRLKGLFKVLVGESPPHTAKVSSEGHVEQGDMRATELPPLLHVPSAAHLHAYVRALGWMGDHEGISALVQWLVQYRAELKAQRARDRNARDLMRRTIVAIRVFLERSWLYESQGVEADTTVGGEGPAASHVGDRRITNIRRLEAAASAELVDKVRELIEGVDDWRGWASEDEVERYCRDARFAQTRDMSQ